MRISLVPAPPAAKGTPPTAPRAAPNAAPSDSNSRLVRLADDSPLLQKKDPRPVTKGPEVSFDLGNGVKLEVVKINAKGKKFLMGSPKDEPGRKDDEEQHEGPDRRRRVDPNYKGPFRRGADATRPDAADE